MVVDDHQITLGQRIVASSSGAILTSIFVNPLDVVKVRMQKDISATRGRSGRVTPLDVVKTRMQAQLAPLRFGKCFLYSNGLMDHICTCSSYYPAPKASYFASAFPAVKCPWYSRPLGPSNNSLDALIKITRKEGVRSLWSGLSPTLVMAVPATVFYFSIYDATLKTLRKRLKKNTVMVPMIAGSSARFIAVTVISPLEMIRTKLQSERFMISEIVNIIRNSVSTNGIRILWLGWVPTILRDVPFSAIYWSLYEVLKKRLKEQWKNHTFGVGFVSGAISGGVASVLTLPFDVVKTHRQIELGEKYLTQKRANNSTGAVSRSTLAIILQLYHQQGIRSLFTGLVPRLIKVAPACAIMIGTYEWGKTFFHKKNLAKTTAI